MVHLDDIPNFLGYLFCESYHDFFHCRMIVFTKEVDWVQTLEATPGTTLSVTRSPPVVDPFRLFGDQTTLTDQYRPPHPPV